MKKVLIAVGVVIVLVLALLFFGISRLGPIIRQAVNTQGPKITGTELRLGDVDVALFSGRAKLQDFLLGNPGGFDSPRALTVKSILVDVDEKSLTGDTIIIDRVEVVRPEIFFEKKGRTDNFKTILNQVKSATGGRGSRGTEPDGGEKSGKKLLIREFVVRDGQVNVTVSGLQGRKITATLPELRLQNIGGQQQGVVPAEAARQIVEALYGKIVSPEVTAALSRELQTLGGEARAMGEEAVRGTVESAGQKAGEGVESAKEKLKGLLDQ
jgi:uncharacterized protein involved in outer membrane biogenesis